MPTMKFPVAANLSAALSIYRERYGSPTLIRLPPEAWTKAGCPKSVGGIKVECGTGRMVEIASE